MNNLVLVFLTKEGKKANFRIQKVKEGLTETEVTALADVILAKNIFFEGNKEFAALESAELETTTVIL